jgi:DNA-nicking Smr family endonuclease
MKVALEEITGVEEVVPGKVIQSSRRDNITVSSQPPESPSTGEINVIGMTVEQASELVDKFLTNRFSRVERACASFTDTERARCASLAEFLKKHPSVAQSAFETEEHGGKAITVVELRS